MREAQHAEKMQRKQIGLPAHFCPVPSCPVVVHLLLVSPVSLAKIVLPQPISELHGGRSLA